MKIKTEVRVVDLVVPHKREQVNRIIEVEGEVFIWRDEKEYAVKILKTFEKKREDFIEEDFVDFMRYFYRNCEKIEDSWKLVENLEGLQGKVLGQREVPLNETWKDNLWNYKS